MTARQVGRLGDGSIISNLTNAIVIAGNAGIAGATLTTSDGDTVTADASGDYALVVSSGWSGTVTPTLTGYTFSPTTITVTSIAANTTGQDFVATADVSLVDNLVAYWLLNESSGSRRSSVSQENTLLDTGTAGSLNGHALFVLADSDYITIADNAAISLGS